MNTNLASFLITSAAKYPDRLALVDEKKTMTYASLLGAAVRMSLDLIHAGVKVGDPVAILLERSCDVVVAMHAVLLCGGIYAPLDTKAPAARLASMLRCLDTQFIVHDGHSWLANEAKEGAFTLIAPEDAHVSTLDAAINIPECLKIRTTAVLATDPCYIIFTSGSTGEPKGVTVSHSAACNYIHWVSSELSIRGNAQFASQAPFHFDNSVLDVYATLDNGATLHILPAYLFGFPRRLYELLLEKKISHLFWVPSALAAIAATGQLSETPAPEIQHVLFAGEVMPPVVLKQWMDSMPVARFSNLYGPTEVTVDCTWHEVPRQYSGGPVPIGYPGANMAVDVLDEKGNLCADETVGELIVRGAGIALGYWRRPELTESAFIQDPRHNHFHSRTYRTGDLGFRDRHGCLHFVGRRDGQVKRRGYRVELAEIEHALGTYASVGRCAVVFQQSLDRIILFSEALGAADLKQVRNHLKDLLPQYMLPDEIRHVVALPLSPSGKIDRKTLLLEADSPK